MIDAPARAKIYTEESDLQPICDLLNLCDALDNLEDSYDVEDLRVEFSHPELNKVLDLQLWEDANGRLVGFGQLWLRTLASEQGETLEGHLYFRVHPEAREGDVANQIVEWGTERLRSAGRESGKPTYLSGAARDHDTYTIKVLEQHGLAVVRYFFRMACPLDLPIPEEPFPAGYTLRHVASEADIAAWVEVYNQSFIDHWNHHPTTLESHKHWMNLPGYRPEDDLVAVAPDGSFGAFCFCEINSSENERKGRKDGWINLLGTRRGQRNMGLGRAMLLAGLHRLKAIGMETAVLGVDAENPSGALRLYEGVGFTKQFTTLTYQKTVE